MRKATFYDTVRFENAMPIRLSTIIDDAERAGRLTLTGAQIAAALPDSSPAALRQALHRQQRRGRIVRLARGADQWVIVPLMHAQSGAPPLESWLHRFLGSALHVPYYVGLLSAAEAYGISPYAPAVVQVMVSKQRRPLMVGRQRLVFHTRVRITAMPMRWHETPDGRYLVSTPELTMLDLVRRRDLAGGTGRVSEVIEGLGAYARSEELAAALIAADDTPTAQRLGALLSRQGSELAETVAAFLKNRPLRTVALSSGRTDQLHQDERFRVLLPERLSESNT
ncbi:MAG: type IV toxin-antitoxin system AbiEi family antitoxin domain-containing protein [Sciscionella sp.]